MIPILETCRFVRGNARHVRLNEERAFDFANSFRRTQSGHWLAVAPFDFSRLTNEEKLHFLLLFNALSFSYWGDPKWTMEYAGRSLDGAWGMIAALGRGIDEGVPLLDFAFCSTMPREAFAHLLRGSVRIPLLDERWKILHEVGSVVTSAYDGKVANLVESASGDAQALLEIILRDLPSFRDSSLYRGQEIFFEKRAQLLVGDIFQMFGGQNFGALRRVDEITACADYKLPMILRSLGIFEYTPDLAERIDQKVEIAHDSEEEVELRALTIYAVDLIKEEVRKRHPDILSMEINDYLWLATQEKIAGEKPYHRTRTTAY